MNSCMYAYLVSMATSDVTDRDAYIGSRQRKSRYAVKQRSRVVAGQTRAADVAGRSQHDTRGTR